MIATKCTFLFLSAFCYDHILLFFKYVSREKLGSLEQNNNFSLLVDKSTQTASTGTDNIDKMSASTGTPIHNDVNATPNSADINADNCKQRKSKDACAIL